jgi:hypothetical protein
MLEQNNIHPNEIIGKLDTEKPLSFDNIINPYIGKDKLAKMYNVFENRMN